MVIVSRPNVISDGCAGFGQDGVAKVGAGSREPNTGQEYLVGNEDSTHLQELLASPIGQFGVDVGECRFVKHLLYEPKANRDA
jgi:hypothetical protein